MVALAMFATVGAAPAATAETTAGGSATLDGCRERFVIAPGDPQLVDARVPDEFELSRDPSGRPLLYVTAIQCTSYGVDGLGVPTTAAAFAAMIKSPDGVGCSSGWPVVGSVKGDALACSMYVLFAAYDNLSVVTWLLDGTPGAPVHYVEDLTFDEGAIEVAEAGARLQFDAGTPTPSPFEMRAVVRERPALTPFTATFWSKTETGLVRMRFESPMLGLGEARGTVRPAPGSEMAQMLGAAEVAGGAPFTLIAGNRWDHGTLTKTLFTAGG